jgi:hypothetical protein
MVDTEELAAGGADPASELIATFLRTARALFSTGGVEITLQAVVDLAVATIEGCDFAGIFVMKSGQVVVAVHTDVLVAGIDNRQVAAGAGPCVDAIEQSLPVYVEDLAVDTRWPAFGREAAAAGIRSLLALRVASDGARGALSLYASYPSAFGAADRARGLVLAGLAGVAVAVAQAREEDVRQAENLRQALVTRELIGQAQGILMERERITAEQAFDILRGASQHLNVKLREVAQDLVDTGEKPDVGPSRAPEQATPAT